MMRLFLGTLLVFVLLAGCSGSDSELATNQQATAAALAAGEGPAATRVDPVEAGEAAGNGDNAAASSTPEPDAGLLNAQATATAAQQELESTRAAATAQAEAAAGEAQATLAPIQSELASFGVNASAGELAWIHPPVTVQAEGYLQYDYANNFLATLAQDFVLTADITWNTQFGTTGCGFIVRTDGNEEAVNQYLIIATRGAQGHVLFTSQEEGEVDYEDTVDIYANGIDPLFEWQNDTTNRLAVVARGEEFTIYTNGTEIGTVTGESGFLEGFVAFVALNESGTTTCQFDNAWLWLMQ